MEQTMNIFLLEDRKADVELIKRAILKHNPRVAFTHASNEAEFMERLGWGNYDVILADYHLPGYGGLEALLHVKTIEPDLPFIFVTGMLDSEMKVAQAILDGANGYVLKENLTELYPHIMKALDATTAKKKRRMLKARAAQDRSLKIQKAIALVNSAGDFEGKNTVIELLTSIEAIGLEEAGDR